MCGSCWPTYPNFFNPTLNIKMVFEEKIPKMGTFSDFVTIFFALNVITKFNNFPTYLQHAHSRTAVRNSRTETVMHALIIWYLRAKFLCTHNQ